MTSASADVHRKVRQLDNDVNSIYDILGRIEKTQGDHSTQLTDLATGQNRVGATLTRQANRLEELAVGQEAHAAELVKIQITQQRQSNRLDELAGTQDEHGGILAEHSTVLAEHSTVLAEHSTVLAGHTAVLAEHSTKLDTILELLRAR
jgi:chromosome segregation ATPase